MILGHYKHTPTPMDKIKPNSKSKKKSKILKKLKFNPITVQNNQIKLVLKNKERETLIYFISVISDKERKRVREWEIFHGSFDSVTNYWVINSIISQPILTTKFNWKIVTNSYLSLLQTLFFFQPLTTSYLSFIVKLL